MATRQNGALLTEREEEPQNKVNPTRAHRTSSGVLLDVSRRQPRSLKRGTLFGLHVSWNLLRRGAEVCRGSGSVGPNRYDRTMDT